MRVQPTAILVLLALVSCTAPRDSTSHEVAGYLRQLAEWAPQEAEAARAVRRILATQFVDEAEVRRQIAESRPRVEAQVAALSAYRARSRELSEVHRNYLEGWRRLARGYDEIEQGLDRTDQRALARGRAALVAWRDTVMSTARRLREMEGQPEPETGRGSSI